MRIFFEKGLRRTIDNWSKKITKTQNHLDRIGITTIEIHLQTDILNQAIRVKSIYDLSRLLHKQEFIYKIQYFVKPREVYVTQNHQQAIPKIYLEILTKNISEYNQAVEAFDFNLPIKVDYLCNVENKWFLYRIIHPTEFKLGGIVLQEWMGQLDQQAPQISIELACQIEAKLKSVFFSMKEEADYITTTRKNKRTKFVKEFLDDAYIDEDLKELRNFLYRSHGEIKTIDALCHMIKADHTKNNRRKTKVNFQ